MGFFDFLKKKDSGAIDKLPDNLDTPQEIVDKVKDLATDNKDMVNNVADRIAKAIPGEADDKIIGNVKDKLNG